MSYTKNVRSVSAGTGAFTKIVRVVGGSSSGGGGSVDNGGTADRPADGGAIGNMFFDTDLDKLYVWNGSAWVDVT